MQRFKVNSPWEFLAGLGIPRSLALLRWFLFIICHASELCFGVGVGRSRFFWQQFDKLANRGESGVRCQRKMSVRFSLIDKITPSNLWYLKVSQVWSWVAGMNPNPWNIMLCWDEYLLRGKFAFPVTSQTRGTPTLYMQTIVGIWLQNYALANMVSDFEKVLWGLSYWIKWFIWYLRRLTSCLPQIYYTFFWNRYQSFLMPKTVKIDTGCFKNSLLSKVSWTGVDGCVLLQIASISKNWHVVHF